MSSRIAVASSASDGSARAVSSRPVASQPLSTDDRNGFTWLPFSGQMRSLAPLCGSYQL